MRGCQGFLVHHAVRDQNTLSPTSMFGSSPPPGPDRPHIDQSRWVPCHAGTAQHRGLGRYGVPGPHPRHHPGACRADRRAEEAAEPGPGVVLIRRGVVGEGGVTEYQHGGGIRETWRRAIAHAEMTLAGTAHAGDGSLGTKSQSLLRVVVPAIGTGSARQGSGSAPLPPAPVRRGHGGRDLERKGPESAPGRLPPGPG
ncbi:hypothetical protein F751_0035 [Auxenochlorella protothecoides]|uniref:Uncharacterized protein n=1 Tax=Auxenochlorella protothecoides TaxID=3075 RepID=A0A087S9G9_AUXPR|nr:hypothetical protein F751_0035 [Auxenochlorella protothecoides]KFM22373.1 hypothetical protein F751_0035 [Auxenochlorella protothecoides]